MPYGSRTDPVLTCFQSRCSRGVRVDNLKHQYFILILQDPMWIIQVPCWHIHRMGAQGGTCLVEVQSCTMYCQTHLDYGSFSGSMGRRLRLCWWRMSLLQRPWSSSSTRVVLASRGNVLSTDSLQITYATHHQQNRLAVGPSYNIHPQYM